MELALLLYVASIAENFRGGLGFFQIIFFLVALVSGIVSLVTVMASTEKSFRHDDFDTIIRANKIMRRTFFAAFLSWVALTLFIGLVPSRRDVYVMAGGYVALKAVNNNVVQATANSALNSIEKWLDKEITRDELTRDEKKPAKKDTK